MTEATSRAIRAIGNTATIFENPFLSVQTTPVAFPNGTVGSYSTVQSGDGFGALVVPMIEFRGMRHYGLITVDRFPIERVSVEFPRGDTRDLSPEEAAREILEETGIEAPTVRRIGTIHPDTGLLTTEVGVWIARSVVGDDELTRVFVEEATGGEFRWYSAGQVAGMIRAGKITCSMTLAAYAMTLH